MLAGFLALFAFPAAAQTGAGEHCTHEAAPHGGMHAAHDHNAAAIEEIPAGSAGSQAPCPHNPNQVSDESMMTKCSMKTGCCIRSDGPLSSGRSNRPAADNDIALSDSPAWPAISRIMNAASYRWVLPQDRVEPNLRPPSA